MEKMSKVGDFLVGVVPSPIYRFGYWVKERPKYIKWWFQRANGKLPECDAWEYKETLFRSLKQGLEYLLREDSPIACSSDRAHRKMKKDLEFAYEWLDLAEEVMLDKYLVITSPDREGCPEVIGCGAVDYWEVGDVAYCTKEWWEGFEKDQMKTFKILGKYLWRL